VSVGPPLREGASLATSGGVPLTLPWRGLDRMGEPLEVRQASRRDAARYIEHTATLVAETHFMLQGPEDVLASLAEQQEQLEALDKRANCLGLTAGRPGPSPGRQRILGSLSLVGGKSRRTEHVVELSMGVLREAWGRGLGGLLLDLALAWARESPMVRRVSLQVYADNAPALALYRSRGFAEEGVLRRYVKDGSRSWDLIGMGLVFPGLARAGAPGRRGARGVGRG